ncbi:MAG: secondary thiamine-phosphate synthase enzyme YjbQ [Pseudomonadota bacterium]
MTAAQTELSIDTRGSGLYEFTDGVIAWVAQEARSGPALLTVFIRHTSASLLIQENADPDVRRDLDNYFARAVPAADDPSMDYLRHRSEGPDDMPAHIKSALTATTLSIPVRDRRLLLGFWQGLYLFEHRAKAHTRKIVLHLA